MKCPHCLVSFFDHWIDNRINWGDQWTGWKYRSTYCSACRDPIVQVGAGNNPPVWLAVFPRSSSRGPIPPEVPPEIAEDFREACDVLSVSPKASAALSRRCLQVILRSHGYKERDLAKEVDALLAETDASKAIPVTLRTAVDGIRNFGNFSAHPITDVTTLQIIDVEPEEAEWCLEIIEEMFEHFYVRPAQATARKAALDAKLVAAGKPPSK